VRRVRDDGLIKWQQRGVYVAETLAGETVGFDPIAEDTWNVYFADVPLGILEGQQFRRAPGRRRLRQLVHNP
jgi:hypothetical protein